MGTQIEINFGWAIVPDLTAIAGLSQVIGFFRRKSD
jgi:hypothetical protein